ncbi:MAG TPA: PLP-dependent aminotransferase family protein, partial [Paraburkholderia sp.]|nr:PLP-dependent aminotransferase family protein [Paraburkholderia sp.]
MKITLDVATATPLTEQIVGQVEALILSRELRVGMRLPSIRKFAAEHNISRFPVIEAYDRLATRGLLQPKHGSGYYVAEQFEKAPRVTRGLDAIRATPESDQILRQFERPDEVLNLSIGFIPEAWRDVEGIAQAIRQASRTDARSLIDYAIPQGDPVLRLQIEQRLAFVGVAAEPQNIMVTNSASEALDLVVRMLLKPGDTVFVEDPGYFNLFGLLKLQGIELVGVPRLSTGPDVDAVEALLKEHRPKLFFVNTVFHNPTGTNVAPHVGFRLLQLAQEHDFMIVEDDVYADFQAIPTQRLASLDRLTRVVYIGGFSKSLSSSLRLGYIAAEAGLIKHFVEVKALTSLGGTRFSERVVAALLERGTYRKHLERLRRRVNGAISTAVELLADIGWQVF